MTDAMTKHYLYRIQLPNGRGYVGRSFQPQTRFAQHCRDDTSIGLAIRHFGPDKCKFEILTEGSDSAISELESRAIRWFNTGYPAGHNGAPTLSAAELQAWSNGLDAVFAPAMPPEKCRNSGWLEITANPVGMGAIAEIFPGCKFHWERLRRPWEGWCSTVFNLPRLAAFRSRTLRFELIGLDCRYALADAEFASLLAHAAHDQGARAAWFVDEDAAVHPFFRQIEEQTECRKPAEQPTAQAEQPRQRICLHYAPKGRRQPRVCLMVLPSQSRSSLSMGRPPDKIPDSESAQMVRRQIQGVHR